MLTCLFFCFLRYSLKMVYIGDRIELDLYRYSKIFGLNDNLYRFIGHISLYAVSVKIDLEAL